VAAFLQDLIRSLVPIDGPLLTQLPPALRQTGKWVAIGTGSALLLVWNDQLVLITGAGVGILFAAYGMRSIGWRAMITDGMNLLDDLNTKLNRHQQAGVNQPRKHLPDYNHCLRDITDADPLKRLIAVRQLHDIIIVAKPTQQAHIAEYFRIMLSREPDEMIREALLEGLAMISKIEPLKNRRQPSSRPIQLRQTIFPPSLEASLETAFAIRATEERFERESTIG
jgi:hypothetical protein